MRGSTSGSFRRSFGPYSSSFTSSSRSISSNFSNFLSTSSFRYPFSMSNNTPSTVNSSSSTNQRGRCMELMQTTPLVTLMITILCVVIYIADNLGEYGQNLQEFAMVPYLVLYEGQWYRMITCAFLHGGLLHIGFNMLSLFSLGSSLESLFGSLRLFFLLMVYVLGCGILYLLMSIFLAYTWSPQSLIQGAVGFSGVLFAMAVDETSLSPLPTRSIFGLFSVPTKIYPWVLMIILQIVIPGVSFLGHLAGIIIGMIHTHKGLNWCLPSLPTLRKLEESRFMQCIVRTRMYKMVPINDALLIVENSASFRSTLASFGTWIKMVLAPITQCLGRYVPASVSSRFASFTSSSSSSSNNSAGGMTNSSNGNRSRTIDNTGRLTVATNQGGSNPSSNGGNVLGRNPDNYSVMIEDSNNNSTNSNDTLATSHLQPGRIENATTTGSKGTLTTIANTLGAHTSGNSYGYDRLHSTEEETMDEQIIVNTVEENNTVPNNVNVPSNMNSSVQGGVVNSNLTPEQLQKRAEVRAKALAAAEARAAAAKSVGKPVESPRN